MKTLKIIPIFIGVAILLTANLSSAAESNVYLTDESGAQKTQFKAGDEVWINGVCLPGSGTTVRVYVSNDRNWTSGDVLKSDTGGFVEVQVDSDGVITSKNIFQPYAYDGNYDVLISTTPSTGGERKLQGFEEQCVIGLNSTGFTVGSPQPAPAPQPEPTPAPEPEPAVSDTVAPSKDEAEPSQPSLNLKLGSWVEVKKLANVRETPGGSLSGEQPSGTKGKVVGGPVEAKIGGASYWFWNIDFENSPDGWVAELTIKSGSPPPEPAATSDDGAETDEREAVAEALRKLAEKENNPEQSPAQVTEAPGSSLLLNSLLIGVAIFLGFIIGSSIIAKAIRKG